MIVDWQPRPDVRALFEEAGLTLTIDAPARDAEDPWWFAECTVNGREVMGGSPCGEGVALYDLMSKLPEPYSAAVWGKYDPEAYAQEGQRHE